MTDLPLPYFPVDDSIFHYPGSISKDLAGNLVFTVGHLTDKSGQRYLLSNEQLLQHHALLPRVVQAFLEFDKDVYKHQLLETLHLRDNNCFKCKTTDGDVALLLSLWDVSVDYEDRAWIRGEQATVRAVVLDGEKIDLVLHSQVSDLAFTKSALSAAYPGWEERLHTAQALDMEDTELTAFVFTKLDVPTIPLEGVNFD